MTNIIENNNHIINTIILCDCVDIIPNPNTTIFYRDIEYRNMKESQDTDGDIQIPLATSVNNIENEYSQRDSINAEVSNTHNIIVIQPDIMFNQNRNTMSRNTYIYMSVVLIIMFFVVILSIIIILM